MPFALVFIGMLLFITGFQNTYKDLGRQVAGDFTGPGNFVYWIVAIGFVGILGYNKTLKPFSNACLALIILAMFLAKNGGFAQGVQFFKSLNEGLNAGTSTKPLPAGGNDPALAGSASAGGGGGLFDFSNIGQDIGLVETVASFLP